MKGNTVGTKWRRRYTKESVKRLAEARRAKTPKVKELPTEAFQNLLGSLKAAGHLEISRFVRMETNELETFTGGPGLSMVEKNIRFRVSQDSKKSDGEAPHVTGYMESAFDGDKRMYRIKGWFNEDGTIRIEVVK